MPSKQQISRLFALANNAGLDNAAVHNEIASRYGYESVKQLTPREYEEFTADVSRWGDREGEPDIAPIDKHVGTTGGCFMVINQMVEAGAFFGDATDDDLETAANLLDHFRRYRSTWRRLAVTQIEAIVAGWRQYDLADWREAAKRFMTQSSLKDEKYFQGILRRVAKEPAVPRSACGHG